MMFVNKNHKENYPIIPNFFIETKGQTFFESVTSMGYEGITAKRMELFTFTVEAQRTPRDKQFFVCREIPTNKKA